MMLLFIFVCASPFFFFFFFFNDTATTEIYTLSLHDALPISRMAATFEPSKIVRALRAAHLHDSRSEEHTSELQSPCNLVCRLLLEKKKKIRKKSPSMERRRKGIISSKTGLRGETSCRVGSPQ